MPTHAIHRYTVSRLRPSRWAAAGLWLLVGLSASYWALRVWSVTPSVPVPTLNEAQQSVDAAAVARALGGQDANGSQESGEPSQDSQHSLLGIVRDSRGQGAALISSSGQPPKHYSVGASLPDGWVLRSLTPREAVLRDASGAAEQRLALPVRP